MTQCIIDGCEKEAKTRGLCNGCYGSALRAVKSRLATWDELVSAGLALGAKRASDPSMFSQALKRQLGVDSEPATGEQITLQGVPIVHDPGLGPNEAVITPPVTQTLPDGQQPQVEPQQPTAPPPWAK